MYLRRPTPEGSRDLFVTVKSVDYLVLPFSNEGTGEDIEVRLRVNTRQTSCEKIHSTIALSRVSSQSVLLFHLFFRESSINSDDIEYFEKWNLRARARLLCEIILIELGINVKTTHVSALSRKTHG